MHLSYTRVDTEAHTNLKGHFFCQNVMALSNDDDDNFFNHLANGHIKKQ